MEKEFYNMPWGGYSDNNNRNINVYLIIIGYISREKDEGTSNS